MLRSERSGEDGTGASSSPKFSTGGSPEDSLDSDSQNEESDQKSKAAGLRDDEEDTNDESLSTAPSKGKRKVGGSEKKEGTIGAETDLEQAKEGFIPGETGELAKLGERRE
mmetsp:Transcript_1946/g.3374  ORF Transcript_1946/g.3374 Transcript_1946/m.3374 type:complete len:111 (+) Transcript_1946:1291-1623(+)